METDADISNDKKHRKRTKLLLNSIKEQVLCFTYCYCAVFIFAYIFYIHIEII